MSELTGKAAMRDSSWYACPKGSRRFHVAIDGAAACNRNTILNETRARDLQDVPKVLRCLKAGCFERWPKGELKDGEVG